MNDIEITHIRWSRWNNKKKEIGVAKSKIKSGLNKIVITAKDVKGELIHPEPIIKSYEDIISNELEEINNGLDGYYVEVEIDNR